MRYSRNGLAGMLEFFQFPARAGEASTTKFAVNAIRERKLMAKLNINGTIRDVEVEADTPLLWVIREQVGLTGTKYGCGVAQCGACSVHINGEVQRSCSIRVGDVKATDRIVTIEGLSRQHLASRAEGLGGGRRAAMRLLPVRARSWRPRRCSRRTPKPSDADIDEAMTNICRCGTYQRIRAAVHMAAGTSQHPKARGRTP